MILVAGVGNLFLGDDGFGPEVVRRLASEGMPEGVRVVDYGIRGMHLAYELLDPYDALVLVDAVPFDAAPGELRVLEVGPEDLQVTALDGGGSNAPGLNAPGLNAPGLNAHGMDPAAMLASLSVLGGRMPRTIVVGCRPADLSERIGLSPAVSAAVGRAADQVRATVELLTGSESGRRGVVTGRDG